MNEQEKRIVEMAGELVPRMSDEEKARLLGYMEGIASVLRRENGTEDRPAS